MENIEARLHDWYTYWLITSKTNDAMGLIGFKGLEDTYVEVGYGICKAYEGFGYMSEALKLLIKWSKENDALGITATSVRKDNYGSQKVLEKNGFKRVHESGDTIDYILEHDVSCNCN